MTTERSHITEHCLKIFNNDLDLLVRKLSDLHIKIYFTNTAFPCVVRYSLLPQDNSLMAIYVPH